MQFENPPFDGPNTDISTQYLKAMVNRYLMPLLILHYILRIFVPDKLQWFFLQYFGYLSSDKGNGMVNQFCIYNQANKTFFFQRQTI